MRALFVVLNDDMKISKDARSTSIKNKPRSDATSVASNLEVETLDDVETTNDLEMVHVPSTKAGSRKRGPDSAAGASAKRN